MARAIYRFLERLTVYTNVEFELVKMLIFKGDIIIKLRFCLVDANLGFVVRHPSSFYRARLYIRSTRKFLTN